MCPECGGYNSTIRDSRKENGYIRRRRYCSCGKRYSTVEVIGVMVPKNSPDYYPEKAHISGAAEQELAALREVLQQFGQAIGVQTSSSRPHDEVAEANDGKPEGDVESSSLVNVPEAVE